MITYFSFLDRIINDGIDAAKESYQKQSQEHKLEGSIAGFEACRAMCPTDLAKLLDECRASTQAAFVGQIEVKDYWRLRCIELEVEWVCNCVSAMLMNEGYETIVTPTARGLMKAAQIIGVTSH